jgi:phosphoserine phosphatase
VTTPAKRVGYRMRELADMVSASPGITKSDALRAADLPTRGMGSGRELNRAIAAGLILVEHAHARRTHLFATERDRRRWQLAREAMTPGTSAERVAEIRAEINRLDAERAATWAH